MSTAVLNATLPVVPWMDAAAWRLPGVQPVGDAPWLMRTDAFAGQMALRDRLIAERPEKVHAITEGTEDAARECLETVLDHLRDDPDYRVGRTEVTRPDGATVALTGLPPLMTIGRLVQEDICLMQKGADEHILAGAILCFPASWTLAQKIGRPMTGIHVPVREYDDDLAVRVERIMGAVRVGQPLWRANALYYDEPNLHTPRLEGAAHRKAVAKTYIRSERQLFRRLPGTGVLVFSILTSMIRVSDLGDAARAALAEAGLKSD